MTDQVTPEIKKIEDLFKVLAWDTLINSTLASFGLFNFWPLNQIIKFFTDRVYEFLRVQFDLQAITFINQEHKAAFDGAAVKLKILYLEKGADSEEYKTAKVQATTALSNFVRFST